MVQLQRDWVFTVSVADFDMVFNMALYTVYFGVCYVMSLLL